MSYPIKSPRKLIEVALPLNAINEACVKEKNPFLKGHPRAVHLWWARRPIAAARAVLFAQLVNDPGYQQGGGFKYGKNKKEAAEERKRLFKIIEDLVLWENTENEVVLERARVEIRRSWREVCELNKEHPQAKELFNPDKLPAFHDPFAGGGAIPLEAQRLGLESFASDLNPVAVLINKAMIEIPPKFAGRPPVSITGKKAKTAKKELGLERTWPGAEGLAEDIRYYGEWMREEAQKRIGKLYPPIEILAQMAKDRPDLQPLVGQKVTPVAWLWARTVKSPNPAFSHVHVPLCATFTLSNKKGKEAYVVPIVEGDNYSFTVKHGVPTETADEGTKAIGRGSNFRCLLSDVPISGDYIKAEGQAGRMGVRLLAIVAEGVRRKVYLAPTKEAEAIALEANPTWRPIGDVPARLTGGTCVPYGFRQWGDLFTSRQLVALTLFTDLAQEVRKKICEDALSSGLTDNGIGLDAGGTGISAYAEAISIFLSCGISQILRYSCSSCSWNRTNENVVQAFGRQAFPMVWDFAEANLLEGSLSIGITTGWVASAIEFVPVSPTGVAQQADAQTQILSQNKVISTDPPYYDNIGYADLSDFFYVWLRRSLQSVLPTLFATIAVPKIEELVATSHRHGGRENAEKFFLEGMTQAMHRLAQQSHPEGPITIYYAFKQSDTEVGAGTASTGWETFLDAVLKAGFQLAGTWPMRTEKVDALKKTTNALASSIILVCRKRPTAAPSISRREFLRELNAVLPEALDEMTKGAGGEYSPVAPVDLSQAIIGPGMAVFSKYAAVLEADGKPMSVRTALQLINRFFGEDDFDADTQFCLHWFEQHGWTEGVFGDAETLSRGKGTSVDGMKEAGVLQSGGGKVRLLKWSEYPADWDPSTDKRTPIWEALHQLIRAFRQGGDSASGALLAALGGKAEAVRQLAYRLYTLCERLGQAEDARAYNELITSWTGIESAAAAAPKPAAQELPGFER
jgi:putative DNA methylase